MEKIKLSKEKLKKMYEDKNLTTFQIADKMGCCQTTIWKKLKKFEIKPKLPGVKRVNISKEQLEILYIKKKLSTWQIEKKTGISRGTLHRKLKVFRIITRNRSESHIIHPKQNFSENLIEKAYLIGFRIGDLGVRKQYPNSETICVASGSTIKEQIELIDNLFKKYGRVWVKKSGNNKINIQVILNDSFKFLLSKDYPIWANNNKETFFSFLAGFTDAEGNIGIHNKMAKYSLGNYDLQLLTKIHKELNKYGIKCNKPTTDKRKGKKNMEGYFYSDNYSQLSIYSKESLEKLFREIKPLVKHANKVKALNIAIENIKQRNKR